MAPIPILDCTGLQGKVSDVENNQAFKELTKKLEQGLKEVGIVYLKNHGIPDDLVKEFFEKSKQFFELPDEVKLKYRKVDAVENFHGYSHAGDENLHEHKVHSTEDYNETWDTWGDDAFDESKFPAEVSGFKGAFDSLWPRLVELGKTILQSFGSILELEDPNSLLEKHLHFDDHSVQTQEVFRSYYYQPIDETVQIKEDTLRLSKHCDWGTFTLMIQDGLGGFEIQDKASKEWIPVPPVEGTIILCPGLMIENWSGGKIQATRHRVRAHKDTAHLPRQSADLYIQPDGNVTCTPLGGDGADWDSKYEKKITGQTHYEYFKERIRRSRAVKN